MPNTEVTNEPTSKQPTGSSKRKRKQSIKRNIAQTDDQDSTDPLKSSKVESVSSKRVRSTRAKDRDCDGQNTKIDAETPSEQEKKSEVEVSDNDNLIDDECEVAGSAAAAAGAAATEKNENQKCKLDNTDYLKCSSTNQECQNCKFCSEHKVTKPDANDPVKRTKKRFSCEVCAQEGTPKVYSTIEKHKQHMATVHDVSKKESKRFECTDCPDKIWFPTKSKFKYHLGAKHPGIIKFVCEVCTETFKLKANYKTHLKTHNIVVEKKFSCDVCNGTFVNKAGFEAHKKRFPGPHIKQSCSHCGFSFSREKHLINHRCKTLLLEEAAARANQSANQTQPASNLKELDDQETLLTVEGSSDKAEAATNVINVERKSVPVTSVTAEDISLVQRVKPVEPGETQTSKRIVLHRVIPRRTQEQTVFRPVQVQTQTLAEPVLVQELREIDFEGGTFIAAATTGEPEQQFIVRDLNGHLVQGNQILHLDINDVQPGEESQVYLADWNIVAPYVIREKSP